MGLREVFVKNITLSADASLIDAARQRAAAERTTLNAEFRRWLADYAGRTHQADAAMASIRPAARRDCQRRPQVHAG